MTTPANLDDLVTQVSQLTHATTNLLNATNVGKQTLDQAVTDAANHASIAGDAVDRAVDAGNAAKTAAQQAKTSASEAKAAEANATAIVHNDEGSVTPSAGKYPVADSKGHLDINWTPLLAAMYPYSGVIGSVDKNDLFEFGQYNSSWSDRFKTGVNNQSLVANIAGRFISIVDTNTIIFLPEAESTAERAIAFDDIFLDWNGNVQTYRSITPHRTTTGYDRDAIATEHGYSKVQTGLYRTGDTYALLLGRVARRNQGAYHPVFNPEGSSNWASKKTHAYGWPWSNSACTAGLATEKEQAFLYPPTWETLDFIGKCHPSYDAHIGTQGSSGRPDGKFYDAIYADDFTPLYYSARNVIDRQALLFDSFNRAVAGETFSGAEGYGTALYSGVLDLNDAYYTNGINGNTLAYPLRQKFDGGGNQGILPIHTNVRVVALRNGKEYSLRLINNSGSATISDTPDAEIVENFAYPNRFLILDHKYAFTPVTSSARSQFLMVDIIGAPEAWPEEWKKHGLPGNLLAVGEEGESLIPETGVTKRYKLSRKCLECYQVLYSNDKGITWSDDTQKWKSVLEGINNSRDYPVPSERVVMIFYRTSANPFELAVNTVVNLLGNEVFATKASGNQDLTAGCPLVSSLINKIPTLGFGGTAGYRDIKLRFLLNKRNELTSGFSEHEQWHDAFNIAPAHQTPGCKMLPYLTNRNERYCLQIMYQEIKSNGTTSGDDLHFRIVDKQTTYTDLNSATCIVGQKRVELPYQFSGEQL